MSQFTKRAIVASFLKLLAEKPLDKITVKDIVEDCGVSRNAFYYYYADIFALMDEIFARETEKVLSAAVDLGSWQEALLHALEFALEHKRLIIHVCHSSCRDRGIRYLYRVTEKAIGESVERQSEGLYSSPEDRQFLSHFYTHAVVGLFLEWVDGGLRQEPEAAIRRMGTLLDGNLRSALIKSDPRNQSAESL